MKVKALSNINHNGTTYRAGQDLEVTDEQAQALFDAGVAKKPGRGKQAEATDTPQAPETPSEDVPSMDWTRKQLDDYALSVGVKEPQSLGSKAEVLKAIEAQSTPDAG